MGLIRGLRTNGVEVAVLAARPRHAEQGEAPEDLSVEVLPIPVPPRRTLGQRLRRPLDELGEPFAERVREASRHADVVHLEESALSWSDHGVASPSLVHLHYRALWDRSLGWPWQRQFRQVGEFALLERMAIRRHRYLVASSPRVAHSMQATNRDAEVVLAPLSLDPRYYPPATLDGPPTAGLIGTAKWAPTAVAMRRLVTRVWPLVRRRVPEARLVVAGRGTSDLALPSVPGVDVVGDVVSSAAFLRGLSVLLYPLERGSGMKVKVLESIATGLPVVTTPEGAEGIEAGDGVVVASDDGQLAAAAAAILADSAERGQRGSMARRAFMQRYRPGPATEPLVDLYRRMA